jgi:hypothetical protein
LGSGIGSRYAVGADWAAMLVLCALAAALASLRNYRFYKEFTEAFAITVWRDFFAVAKKVEHSAEAAVKNGATANKK